MVYTPIIYRQYAVWQSAMNVISCKNTVVEWWATAKVFTQFMYTYLLPSTIFTAATSCCQDDGCKEKELCTSIALGSIYLTNIGK